MLPGDCGRLDTERATSETKRAPRQGDEATAWERLLVAAGDDLYDRYAQQPCPPEQCNAIPVTLTAASGPATPPPVLVLSARRRVLWALEQDGASTRVRALDLDQPIWRELPPAGAPLGRVLAATYSAPDDALYVLDELAGPGRSRHARLVRVETGPRDATAEVLARWPRATPHDVFALATDPAGALYLASGRAHGPLVALVRFGRDRRERAVPTGLLVRPGRLVPEGLRANEHGLTLLLDDPREGAVEWVACTDAVGTEVPGCSASRRRDLGISSAWVDGDDVWLDMLRGSALVGRVVGIARDDGTIVAAWREPPLEGDDPSVYCAVTAKTVGGGRAAFVVHYSNWRESSRSRIWLYVGTPETIGETPEWVHEFPASFVSRDRTIHDLWISAELLALQASPDGSLYTYRDGEWTTLTGRGTVEGLPRGTVVVGDHLLWEAWLSLERLRLVHAHWGSPATVYYDPMPRTLYGFGTDGVDLAWFENDGPRGDGSFERSEIWAAPYRRDLASMEAPRRVARVDLHSTRPAVGGGWIAWRRITEGPQRVEVFSLRDGSRRTFVPPGGYVIDEPYYARARDIMFRGAGTEAIRFDPTLLPPDPEP
ncbi:MAG: hypothetical protein KF729_00120 [Sandaracinaceae bacterium]|nr:hypothetical protein [Sandaracinaceae bacterium]